MKIIDDNGWKQVEPEDGDGLAYVGPLSRNIAKAIAERAPGKPLIVYVTPGYEYDAIGELPPNTSDVAIVGMRGHDSSPRPIIHGGISLTRYPSAGTKSSNINLIGLDFQGDRKQAGINATVPVHNLLACDCRFQRFSAGVSLNGSRGSITYPTFKRCQFVDNDASDGNTPGIYLEGTEEAAFVECLIDRNGYQNADRSDATQLNHGIYAHHSNRGLYVEGCIVSRNSSHGIQAPCGGTFDGNVFHKNAVGISLGYANGKTGRAGGASWLLRGSVIANVVDIAPGIPRGWGVEIDQTASGYIKNVLIVGDESIGEEAALRLIKGNMNNPQDYVGIKVLDIDGLIIHDQDKGIEWAVQPEKWTAKLVAIGSTRVWATKGNPFFPGLFLPPSVALPKVTDDMIEKARNMRRGNWDDAYTGRAISERMLKAYGLTSEPEPEPEPIPEPPVEIPPKRLVVRLVINGEEIVAPVVEE